MKKTALFIALSLVFSAPYAHAKTITGTPRKIIDGDSIRIGKDEIRLQGIDAPEFGQVCLKAGAPFPCGKGSRLYLEKLIRDKTVSCESDEQDKYGRWLSICQADGVNVNDAMVRAGMAVAYLRYTDMFAGAEDEARKEKRGLWALVFLKPEEWRHPDR